MDEPFRSISWSERGQSIICINSFMDISPEGENISLWQMLTDSVWELKENWSPVLHAPCLFGVTSIVAKYSILSNASSVSCFFAWSLCAVDDGSSLSCWLCR